MPKKKFDLKFAQQAIVNSGYNYSILGEGAQWNPAAISFATYDEMRMYPTVASALSVVKLPIQGIDWEIKSNNKEAKRLIEKNLRDLWSEFIKNLLMAYDFGFSPFEKVFKSNGYITIDKLVPLEPKTTNVRVDQYGNFNGLNQKVIQKTIKLDPKYCFVFTHQKEYGNFYGLPRTRSAYPGWFIVRYVLQFNNKFLEKYGTPTLVGYAPAGKTKNKDGKEIDYLDYMLDIMKSIQNASAISLPHTGGKRDEMGFWIDILESKRTGADFINTLEYMDKLIFMGCLVPPLAFSSGEKGSYGLFESQADLHAQNIDAKIAEIKYHIDHYFINCLIEYNFGEGVEAEWKPASVSKRDKELTKSAIIALIQNGQTEYALEILKENMKMPAKELEDVVEDEEEKVAADRKILCKRKSNDLEKHVNFERIEKRLNDSEKAILTGAAMILAKQKKTLLNNIQKAVQSNNLTQLNGIDIPYRAEYEDTIEDIAKDIFQGGVDDVTDEMDLKDLRLPKESKRWVIARAKNIAKKHLDDLQFAVVGAALVSISKELSEKEILFNSETAFNNYLDSELQDSVIMINHKFYDEGRNWAGIEGGIKLAEWSAVLDNKVCDYCAGRDGLIIELSNPDFSQYAPGEVHEYCRCIWVFLDEEEIKADWKSPSKADIKTYYQGG